MRGNPNAVQCLEDAWAEISVNLSLYCHKMDAVIPAIRSTFKTREEGRKREGEGRTRKEKERGRMRTGQS